MKKCYLGDGAYVEPGCYAGEVVITTSNGERTTNRVVLGPSETRSLIDWIEAWRRELDPPMGVDGEN